MTWTHESFQAFLLLIIAHSLPCQKVMGHAVWKDKHMQAQTQIVNQCIMLEDPKPFCLIFSLLQDSRKIDSYLSLFPPQFLSSVGITIPKICSYALVKVCFNKMIIGQSCSVV